MYLDPKTQAMIEAIRSAGFAVNLKYDKVRFVLSARDEEGETWTASGQDLPATVRDLAVQVGVDVESA